MIQKNTLKTFIELSKDGEWGKGNEFDNSVKMLVIRGTDFDSVRKDIIQGLPERFIPKHIAELKKLKSDDIIIETAGGTKGRPTGRTLLIKDKVLNKSPLPLTCASFSRFIRIDSDKVNPQYIFWLLQYLYEKRIMEKYHTQHTGVSRFQWTIFSEKEELNIPNNKIQNNIADILNNYDSLIENNTRRIQLLEEIAKLVYDEWFVKFRFPGHEKIRMIDSELGKIPEGWEVRKLSDIIEFKKGKQSTNLFNNPSDGLFPYLLIDGIKTGSHRYTDEGVFVDTKDIIMVMDGASSGTVYVGHKGFVGSTLAHIYVKDKSISTYFITLFLISNFDKISSNNTGAAIPHANKDFIYGMNIVIPNKEIRDKIFNIFEKLFVLKMNLELKNQNLFFTRDFLLPKLISGQIDVSNLDIKLTEVAS